MSAMWTFRRQREIRARIYYNTPAVAAAGYAELRRLGLTEREAYVSAYGVRQ